MIDLQSTASIIGANVSFATPKAYFAPHALSLASKISDCEHFVTRGIYPFRSPSRGLLKVKRTRDMAYMTLVRHGQANTGAQDEESYDKLSDLGHQQARWLGEHFAENDEHFTRVYCGTMRRHVETTAGIGAGKYADVFQDPRLNEFPYFSLEKAMQEQHGEPVAQSREEFALHLPKTLDYWAQGRLEGVDESFENFTGRVTSVIAEIAEGPGQALVVTSGGFISTVMQQTLSLSTDGWARMCLAIFNSSTHRFQTLLDRPILTQFNGTPHLETRDRHYARTHL